jgi:hypothetical protein
MWTNKQPFRGLIPTVLVLSASSLYVIIGQCLFGLESATIAVYALFFAWIAFIISLCEKWPLRGRKQPLVGLVFLSMALVAGTLHPVIMDILGFDSVLYWPLISNLFLGLGVVIAFDNKLVDGFEQPKAILADALAMYVFAILLLLVFGFVPAIWFAFFVFVFFWMGAWPFTNAKQPAKGVLLFAVMFLFSIILEYLFELVGTTFFNPDAGLWFVLWVWWLVLTSWQLETWPLKGVRQPLKAMGGLIITVALSFASWFVVVDLLNVDAGKAGNLVWIFISWLYTWDIVFGKWPAERGTKAETKEEGESLAGGHAQVVK